MGNTLALKNIRRPKHNTKKKPSPLEQKPKLTRGNLHLDKGTIRGQLLKDQLTCPVCLDIYTDPQSLECRHILCLTCVQKLQGFCLESFNCPECRAPTKKDNFKKNTKIGAIIDTIVTSKQKVVETPSDNYADEEPFHNQYYPPPFMPGSEMWYPYGYSMPNIYNMNQNICYPQHSYYSHASIPRF